MLYDFEKDKKDEREQKKYLRRSVARNRPKLVTDTKPYIWKNQRTSSRRSANILLLGRGGGLRLGAVKSLPRGLKLD